MADLPIDLAAGLAEQLARVLDVEGKIPRALEALGPVGGRDVVLARRRRRDPRPAARRARRAGHARRLERTGRVRRARRAPPTSSSACGRRSVADAPTSRSPRRPRPPPRRPPARRPRLRPRRRRARCAATCPSTACWSRRDGPFLGSGFKVRVVHCWLDLRLAGGGARPSSATASARPGARCAASHDPARGCRTTWRSTTAPSGASADDDRPRSRRRTPDLAAAVVVPRAIALDRLGRRYVAYAVTVRDTSQIPLLASGAVVLGDRLRRARRLLPAGDVAGRHRRARTAGRCWSRWSAADAAIVGAGFLAGASSCSWSPAAALTGRRGALERPREDPLLDSPRAPVPPSSRGLGRHPFKVEIRGSNPLGGTTPPTPGAADRRHDRPATIGRDGDHGRPDPDDHQDNVAQRCDGCHEVIDGTPGGSTSSTSSPPRRPCRWTARPAINPGPVPVPRRSRPASAAGWPTRATCSAAAARSARSCGRSRSRPGRRAGRGRWGLCDGIHRDDHEFVPA